jgi:TP901 family phage tail tape measure protein
MAQTETLTYIIKVQDDASKGLNDVKKDVIGLGDSFSGLDKILFDFFKNSAEKFVEFAVDAGKNFAKYEEALGHARRTMNLTKEETLDLGDTLMNLSTDFSETGLKAGVAANDLAEISGILGQLGFSIRDGEAAFTDLVATVAKVGVAFGMSNAAAAEGLGILSNLYDLPVENISNIASSITVLGNSTVATAGQIMDIMQRMGNIAGLLGVSGQEAAALAATLRESGVRAQVAGTSMSQIFAKLSTDVDKFAEVLKKGGISGEMLRMKIESGDATEALVMVLRALKQIESTEGKIAATTALKDLGLTGVRVQGSLLALANNISGLQDNLKASDKAFKENVAVQESYDAAIDTTSKKWGQFKNLFDIIIKIIGKDLALVFSDFLDNHLIPFAWQMKTWIETSRGAEAIFGKNGFIAQGLAWIGKKMDENEDNIFHWLDTIDDSVPIAIGAAKGAFVGFFEEVGVGFDDLINAIDTVVGWIEKINKAIGSAQEAFKIFRETIRETLQDFGKIGEVLQLDKFFGGIIAMMDEAEKMNQKYGDNMADIDRAINIANDSMGGLIETTNEANQAGEKMHEDWVGHSHLPDIINALDDVYDTGHNTFSNLEKDVSSMDSVFQRTQVPLTELPGQFDKIYMTGTNSFSNLRKELLNYKGDFDATNKLVVRGTGDEEFALYQTANAYTNLGEIATEAEAEVVAANTKILHSLEAIKTMAEMNAEAMAAQSAAAAEYIGGATAGNVEALGALGGNLNNMSPEALESLLNSKTLTASGIIGAERAQRMQQPVTMPTQSQITNVTLVMNDQEVAKVTNIVSGFQREQQNRTFGSGTQKRF